jgi:hypothetical protein
MRAIIESIVVNERRGLIVLSTYGVLFLLISMYLVDRPRIKGSTSTSTSEFMVSSIGTETETLLLYKPMRMGIKGMPRIRVNTARTVASSMLSRR